MHLCYFIKKDALSQLFSCEFCKISKNTFSTEHLWTTASILAEAVEHLCNFMKKETLAQVFSCEFCEIFKNTFFYRTVPVVASALPGNTK